MRAFCVCIGSRPFTNPVADIVIPLICQSCVLGRAIIGAGQSCTEYANRGRDKHLGGVHTHLQIRHAARSAAVEDHLRLLKPGEQMSYFRCHVA